MLAALYPAEASSPEEMNAEDAAIDLLRVTAGKAGGTLLCPSSFPFAHSSNSFTKVGPSQ